MQFDVRVGHNGTRFQGTRVANPLELITKTRPIGTDGCKRLFNRHAPGVHQRPHHVRLVPDTFLIGKGAYRD
ncbi:hypothetical protein D3C76_1721340 [compost metagenome]